jgi:hypothetical protein
MTDESVIESQQIPANKLKAGWELLQLTFAEWTNDNAFELSAALAFYTIFSNRARTAHRRGRGQFLSRARYGDRSDRW